MRFISRTLPWLVIIIVIAFFIGLKQSPYFFSTRNNSCAEKKLADKTDDSSSDSTSDTSSSIVDESAMEKEEPAGSDDTDTKPSKTSTEPEESQPDPSDGDTIDLKLFEGTVETKTPDRPTGEATDSTMPEATSPVEQNPSEEETTQLDSPIVLSMNPPILRQPITNQDDDSQNQSDTGWQWSKSVKEAQSESEFSNNNSPDNQGVNNQSVNNQSVNNQGEMPNMYGPANEGVIVTEEETDSATTEKNTANTDDNSSSNTTRDQNTSVNKASEKNQEEDEDKPTVKQEIIPRQPLSPEMQKLRNEVRQTITTYSKPILNTRDNTVAQVLDVCEAFGCDAEVMYVDMKRKINAFANLCYNYPCAGYRPLKVSNGRIEPRLGYGFQKTPGQMLAVMALSRVPKDYPIQFNEEITGTVADLVQRERETCRSGEDLAFKLIGISRYTPSGKKWKSESGETWTIERLLSEVMKQPAQLDNVSGTNRLLAISYAVDRRMKRGEPIDGVYAKASKYVTDFQDYALSMINTDGTWHPQFFSSKGTGGNNEDRLLATGHILRWLVFSLPEERLQDPRVVRAIAQIDRSLGGNARYGLAAASPQKIDSRLTAVHALVLYNRRLFTPHDKIDAEAASAETAQNAKEGVK